MTRKKGRLTRRNKAIAKGREEEEKTNVPHSFIIHRGKVGKYVKQLQIDFRKVMEPNTAKKLKETSKNSIKDFISLSGPLNVSHMALFTRTDVGIYFKLCRFPRGPTITFIVDSYCLSSDVITSQKKQMTYGSQFLTAPCLMTNLQPTVGDLHLQLTARMFLDMFPTITPDKTKMSSIRRCCLLNYDKTTDLYDFRHYSIRIVPVGVSKSIKKLNNKKLPDLSKYNNITDYVTKAGLLSESEGEEDADSQITVIHKSTKGRSGPQKSSIRLVELGPRLSLKLLKVEEDVLSGNVLYHRFIKKTPQEKLKLEKTANKKRKLKQLRKKDQDLNVAKKQKLKDEHKERCRAGMNLPKNSTEEASNKDLDTEKDKNVKTKPSEEVDSDNEWEDVTKHSDDDDVQYYIDEVGEKPDADLFNDPRKTKADKEPKEMFKNKGKARNSFKTTPIKSKFNNKPSERQGKNVFKGKPMGKPGRSSSTGPKMNKGKFSQSKKKTKFS